MPQKRKEKTKFKKRERDRRNALQHFRPFMAADCSHGRASFFSLLR
jgi:hypothetical protein